MSRGTSPVVTRSYRKSAHACDSCAQAVRLLLGFVDRKQQGGPTTAPDDAEGLKNDRTDK
jgi:hypothetical protein